MSVQVKRYFRGSLSLCLCLAMLMAILPLSVFAEDAGVYLHFVASDTEVAPGDTVEFTVTGKGKVNVGDTARLYAHVKKTSLLW